MKRGDAKRHESPPYDLRTSSLFEQYRPVFLEINFKDISFIASKRRLLRLNLEKQGIVGMK